MTSFKQFTLVKPVPRDVVESIPYDSFYPPAVIKDEKEDRAKNPWAGSGHYMKEYNLMMSGHKLSTIVERPEILKGAYAPHIMSGKFVYEPYNHGPGHTGKNIYSHVVVQASHPWILKHMFKAFDQGDTHTIGHLLGYQPEDIDYFHERRKRMFGS